MTKISKRSAASRKAWRTRKKMKAARLKVPGEKGLLFQPCYFSAAEYEQPFSPERRAEIDKSLEEISSPSRRLLPPNPFLEIGR